MAARAWWVAVAVLWPQLVPARLMPMDAEAPAVPAAPAAPHTSTTPFLGSRSAPRTRRYGSNVALCDLGPTRRRRASHVSKKEITSAGGGCTLTGYDCIQADSSGSAYFVPYSSDVNRDFSVNPNTGVANYEPGILCYWSIQATSSLRGAVWFHPNYLSGATGCQGSTTTTCSLSIENSGTCSFDYIRAFYGTNATNPGFHQGSTADATKDIFDSFVTKDGENRVCGSAVQAPKPLYTQSTGGYGLTWFFLADFITNRAGFEARVQFFAPIRLDNFPSSLASCTSPSGTTPSIQLMDYTGSAKLDEQYTVTMSALTSGISIQGLSTNLVSSDGKVSFTGFALCGVSTAVTLHFSSAAFNYTHPGTFEVNATVPSQADPPAQDGLSGPTSIPLTITHPADNGSPITSCKIEYFVFPNSTELATQTTTGTSFTIASLTSGTTYGIRVACTNSAGDGPASSYLFVATQPALTKLASIFPAMASTNGSTIITIYGNINVNATHTCSFSAPTASPTYLTQNTSATIVGNTALRCSTPSTFPSFLCNERAIEATLQVFGGDTATFNFAFFTVSSSCYHIHRISVGVDCAHDLNTCVQNTPSVGGQLLYLYDNTISERHWTWLIPNTRDKTTLRCKFVHSTGDVVVSASYQLNTTTRAGSITCLIPSHAAGAALVYFSFDAGTTYLSPVSSTYGTLTYKPCGSGYMATSASESCTVCDSGSFSNTSESTSCTQCTAGYFSKAQASTACTICSPGSYSATIRASSCQSCEVGKFNTAKGQSQCTTCAVGKFAGDLGSVSCEDCPQGRFSALTGSSSCSLCAAGTYTPTARQSTCQSCTAGRFAPIKGSATCTSCPTGKFGLSDGLSQCFACELGFYAPHEGMTICTQCTTAATTLGVGSTSQSDCKCESSFRCTRNCDANQGAMVCEPCPGGATCLAGTPPYAQAGHWRSPSGGVVSCYNANACRGGGGRRDGTAAVHDPFVEEMATALLPTTRRSNENLCAEGCTGTICLSCLDGYAMDMSFLCQECPDDDTQLAAIIAIAVGTGMFFTATAWLTNRLGENFSVAKLMQRDRIRRKRRRKQSLMQTSAARKMVQFFEEKVEESVRDSARDQALGEVELKETSLTAAENTLLEVQECESLVASLRKGGTAFDEVEAEQQLRELLAECRRMVLFAPSHMRNAAVKGVRSVADPEDVGISWCSPRGCSAKVMPEEDETAFKDDQIMDLFELTAPRGGHGGKWKSMTWAARLEAVLEQPGAKVAIELAVQKYERRRASSRDQRLDVLRQKEQEDSIQTRVRNTGYLRDVFSTSSLDGGGYGSSSPVLLFKVFFSALQVLQLARRFDFEWPGYLEDIFAAQSTATGGNTFAVDCFFPGTIGKVYERAFLVVVLPLVLMLVAVLFFYVRYKYKIAHMPRLVAGPETGTNQEMEQTDFFVLTSHEKHLFYSMMLPQEDDAYLSLLRKWPGPVDLWRPIKHHEHGDVLYWEHRYTREIREAPPDPDELGTRATVPGRAIKDFICREVKSSECSSHTRHKSTTWQFDFLDEHDQQTFTNPDQNHLSETARMRRAQVQLVNTLLDHARQRLKNEATDKVTMTCHVWAFLLWPVITSQVLSIFSCYEVDGDYFIFGESTIECYTGDWYWYALVIGVPGLCLTFGVLLLTCYVLVTNKQNILECEYRTTRKYAFLFADYSDRHVCWEVVIMMRKLGVVVAAVCMVSWGVSTQALACLLVVVAASVAHIRFRPYDQWLVDALESASLGTCFVTLYLGLYLHVQTNSDFREFCSVTILLVQAGFLCFFIFCLARSIQEFADRQQKDAFIPLENRMSTLRFLWTFVVTKVCCQNTEQVYTNLELVPPENVMVRDLTDHMYAWDVGRRMEMYLIIRDKYAKKWKLLAAAGQKRRQKLKAVNLMAEFYISVVEWQKKKRVVGCWREASGIANLVVGHSLNQSLEAAEVELRQLQDKIEERQLDKLEKQYEQTQPSARAHVPGGPRLGDVEQVGSMTDLLEIRDRRRKEGGKGRHKIGWATSNDSRSSQENQI